MVYLKPLEGLEEEEPSFGPFSACLTASKQIHTFVHQVCNTELTPAHLSSLCKRSTQLLKEIRAAVDGVEHEIPMESRHLWVKAELDRYEQVVVKMQSMDLKLRGAEKLLPLAMLTEKFDFEGLVVA